MLTLVNETEHAADLVRLMFDGETAAAVVRGVLEREPASRLLSAVESPRATG